MPTPTPSHRRTIADGRALIAAWKASGLTARAYCHANNLSRSRIDFWKRRISRLDRAGGVSPSFVQIAAPAPSPES